MGTAGAAQGGVPGGGALYPRHVRNPIRLDRTADALEHVVGLGALRGGGAQVGRPVRGRIWRQPAQRLQIRPRHQGKHAAPDAPQVGGASGCGSGQGASRLHVQPASARGRLAPGRHGPTGLLPELSAARPAHGSARRPAPAPGRLRVRQRRPCDRRDGEGRGRRRCAGPGVDRAGLRLAAVPKPGRAAFVRTPAAPSGRRAT